MYNMAVSSYKQHRLSFAVPAGASPFINLSCGTDWVNTGMTLDVDANGQAYYDFMYADCTMKVEVGYTDGATVKTSPTYTLVFQGAAADSSLVLTPEAQSAPVMTDIRVTANFTNDDATLYVSDDDAPDCYAVEIFQDPQTGEYCYPACHTFHAGVQRVVAITPDGRRSNTAAMTFTADGDLPQVPNLSINGTPITAWSDPFIVGVPYTVSFDEVDHATEYHMDYSCDDEIGRIGVLYQPETLPATVSGVLVFGEPAADVTFLRVQARGVGYNGSEIMQRNVGSVQASTAAPLTLTAASTEATIGETVSFSVVSTATDAVLCFYQDDPARVRTIPMTNFAGTFMVDVGNVDGVGICTYWVADSDNAVSQKVTVEWKSSITVCPYPSGTPTLNLQATSTSVETYEHVQLSCASTAQSLTFHKVIA